jgi:Protein of unknown function (DUF4239)
MQWIFSLPGWLTGVIVVLLFNALGIAGLYSTRHWIRRQHGVNHSHNDIVSYFLAAVVVFYGITLGLLAISAWTNYSQVEDRVDSEAEVISSLYRDLGPYPEPTRSILRNDLRQYTRDAIDTAWPMQRHGIVPGKSVPSLENFQDTISAFQPATPAQQIIQAEVFRQFNSLIEARRARLNSVHSHMPRALWMLVISGTLITLAVTFFFDTSSFSMHLWLTLLLATLLALMIFLISVLDAPFRGRSGVSPAPMEMVYREMSHAAATGH